MIYSLRTNLRSRPQWQLTLIVIFFAQLISAVGFSIIFPFLPLYVQELGSSGGLSVEFWSGMVFAIPGVTMMFAAPVWGALADRHGRKMMVIRAMFGGTILIFLMGHVQTVEMLVLLRAAQGLITGTVSANNALIAATAPRNRVGFAMGTIQVGLWAGVAVGPLIGGTLADAFGFRLPFIVTALLMSLAGVLVWMFVKEEFVPTEEMRQARGGFISDWRHILSMPGVPLLFVIRFMTGLNRTLIIPIAPLFIQSLHGGDSGVSTLTGLMVGLSSAGATATAIYLGRLGDRIGHRPILIVSALVAAIAYFPQTFVTETWQLLTLQALAGAATGGLISSPSALLARYTEPGEEGSVYGLDNSIVAGSRALAPLIGSLIAVSLGLRFTFMATGLLFLLVVVIAVRWLPGTDPVPRPETT
jgi:DHA1 family multidrug resistance protein-like MFS transporter